ncbi:MAG: S8 family serine peptidase [Candidatus Eisenbacteria bacterium]|nr:S8 family serine peptidase [Candidatus Eisenbacteria bacterium]
MMRVFFAFSMVLGLLLRAAPSTARTEPSLILELAPGSSALSLKALDYGQIEPLFSAHRDPLDPLSRFYRLIPGGAWTAGSSSAALSVQPGVISASPDRISPLAACLPNDFYFAHDEPDSAQWPLHANPQGPDLGAIEAWNVTTGDPDVLLAVLDSGVDWRHPEFGPPLSPAGQIWVNAAEASGQPGIDDDGNGYVDDLRGWDFVDVATIQGEINRVDPAEDGLVPDNDPVDYDGHGTFVAGLAGAAMDDGVGMAGLAPGVRLLPLRVGWREDYIDPGTGRRVNQGVVAMSFCAQAIVYAADNGARVLNCSWLSEETPELKAALDYAIQVKGVLVVDAAGNGGLSTTQSRNYLSRRGDCLEVAALDRTGQLSGVTSIGTWVDLSAPGEKLLSLVRTGVSRLYRINDAGATSFAAPFVSATAALVRSVAPLMTPAEVRTHLMATALNIDHIGLNGNQLYRGKLGAGMVSPVRALLALVPAVRESIAAPLGPVPLVLAGAGFVAVDVQRHLLAWGDGTESRTRLPLDGEIRGVASVMNGSSRIDVVTLRDGHVAVLKDGAFAPGWPRPTGGLLLGNPMIVELGGGAEPEIVVAGTDSLLYAWSLDGTSRPGFPVRLPDAVLTAPAAGDVIPGGAIEIVVVTADDRVSIVTAGGVRTDWSSANLTPLSAARYAAPALADVTGDGRLDVVLTGSDRIGVLPNPAGAQASVLWVSFLGADPMVGEIAVADFQGNGHFSVVTTHESGGVLLRGFVAPPGIVANIEVEASGTPATGAILLATDDSSEPGIVIVTTNGCIEAFRSTGERVPGWPKRLSADATGRVAAGPDLASNTIGLVVETAGGELRRFTIPSTDPIGDSPWGMAGGNAQRTRSLAPTLPTAPVDPEIPDGGQRPIQFSASRNPASAGTPVAFLLSGGSLTDLVIHDIQGRAVRRMRVAPNDNRSGLHWWDGRSDDGRIVSAGLYLARARLADGAVRTARLVVVR